MMPARVAAPRRETDRTEARTGDWNYLLALLLVAFLPRLFVALAWSREPVWDGHYDHFGAERIASRGVSIVLLGGDDIEVAHGAAECTSPTCLEAVAAAQKVSQEADAAAARGLTHFACLVFAPQAAGISRPFESPLPGWLLLTHS